VTLEIERTPSHRSVVTDFDFGRRPSGCLSARFASNLASPYACLYTPAKDMGGLIAMRPFIVLEPRFEHREDQSWRSKVMAGALNQSSARVDGVYSPKPR
jgi:hypothetical protein